MSYRHLLLLASLFVAGHEAAAQTSRFWRPDERVLLSDFSVVRALAGTDSELFVATDLGLLVYDHVFGRWLPPISYLDGFPLRSATVALADPADGSVWVGTTRGLYHYRHRSGMADSLSLPGGVFDLLFDADAAFQGLYVRTARGWEFLSRGSFVTSPAGDLPRRTIRPPAVAQVLNEFPALDAARAELLVDERLRQVHYTSAFLLPHGERVAMGTDGMGAFIAEPFMAQVDRLAYGLVGVGAGAVTVAGGDVWTGSIGDGRRNGFTRVSEDLQRFEFHQGPRAVGFSFTHVRDLLVRAGRLWAATDVGLLVVEPGERPTVLASDLPTADALSLQAGEAGVWVGTARGLVFVDDDLNVSAELGAGPRAVYDMALAGDTLWLATDAGIGMIEPSLGRVGVPLELLDIPELADPALAIAALGDTLVLASAYRNRILWRAEGRWQIESRVSQLGMIISLEADDGSVWLGGETGLGNLNFADGAYRFYNAPRDLPGPVRDIAATQDHLWVATDGGLVRFERRALR